MPPVGHLCAVLIAAKKGAGRGLHPRTDLIGHYIRDSMTTDPVHLRRVQKVYLGRKGGSWWDAGRTIVKSVTVVTRIAGQRSHISA